MRRWVWGTLFVVACGSRTGLLVEEELDASVGDASQGTGKDAGVDAMDALPPIDTGSDHVVPSDCPDASATLVYVFTGTNELYSFYPPTLTFKSIGLLSCPGTTGTPYSMGVSRLGTAYTLFNSGQLYKVSTATASCASTTFASGQDGFVTFGMGYASIADGGESLFVAQASFTNVSKGLATIDTTSFNLGFVAPFAPPLPRCELTGTGDGRLFAFCLNISSTGSIIAQVDPKTAKVIASDSLALGDSMDAFAFAFWGGDFWIFTSPPPATSTTVTRYDPVAKTLTGATTFGASIVGAGVSTCAPQ